jgi:hypothetical protein
MIFGTRQRTSEIGRRQALCAIGAAMLSVSALAGCGGGGGSSQATPAPGSGSTARFIGRVVNNSTNIGISGVTVSLNGASVQTRSDGGFVLDATPASGVVRATVLGPDGRWRASGYYAGSLYNLVKDGFPVLPAAANATVELGTVKLGSADDPPFPPTF